MTVTVILNVQYQSMASFSIIITAWELASRSRVVHYFRVLRQLPSSQSLEQIFRRMKITTKTQFQFQQIILNMYIYLFISSKIICFVFYTFMCSLCWYSK